VPVDARGVEKCGEWGGRPEDAAANSLTLPGPLPLSLDDPLVLGNGGRDRSVGESADGVELLNAGLEAGAAADAELPVDDVDPALAPDDAVNGALPGADHARLALLRIDPRGDDVVEELLDLARGVELVGPWEEVEDLVGAAPDQVESVEGEGRPSTVADEPFQSGAVGGLDTDTGVQAEAAPVIPGQHVLGVVGLQEAVAAEVAEHPTSHGVLEALQELVGEGGGFVEAETGFWIGRILIRVILDPMEEPVHDAQMKMEVGIEAGAETMEEADGTERGVGWCGGRGLPQGRLEGPEEDVEDGAGGPGPMMEEGPETFGHGEDPLADGHVGNDVVHQVSRGLGHALGVA
jgi:hypothetical protein